MSGIIGSKLNIRGSGRIAKLGTDGQVLTSAGAGVSAVYEDAAGGGTSWQSVETGASFSAVAGNGYPVNTTAQACTVTLPASASVGDTIEFVDYARNFATNALTINQNSLKFQGETTPNPVYDTAGESIRIIYVDATKGWVPTSDGAVALETPPFNGGVEWLVIAGGGAGGGGYRGGGGGAGGYRNSYASETSGRNSATETSWVTTQGSVITVVVGAGGAVNNRANGGTGVASSITSDTALSTGTTPITSNGGGGGAEYEADADAGTYGSGAGAGHSDVSATTGSTGTAAQGFDGGDAPQGTSPYTAVQGACGAGAGQDGVDGGTTSATTAGNGLSSSITGSAVTRAGGGGGGTYSAGGYSSGGAGGGGNAGSTGAGDPHSGVATSSPDDAGYYYPVSGTDNKGGGGGGTAWNNSTTYGRGGSGVVILRVPLTDYSGTTTGSPTATTDGTDKVIIFNGSGSYTT
jgi:hypothetical protein